MRVNPALAAWLPTARQIQIVELLTVTKPSGAVWRYATSVDNVVDGTTVYLGSASSGGLLWSRSQLTFKAGIELGDCKVTIQARTTDLINALTPAAAMRARIWDDTTLLLSRAYFDASGVLKGVLPRYQGQLAPVTLRDGDLEMTLKPPSQSFNRAVPPVFQSACLNTLYDSGCGIVRAAWTVSGTTQASSTAALILTGRAEPAAYFTGGVIEFASGVLLGLARTVRIHAADGSVSFFNPFPSAPAVGDSFTLTPGCDRTLGSSGCAKYSNRLRFRGAPFIPKPETVM